MRLKHTAILSIGIATAMLASGCTQLRSHQGYLIDQTLLDSVAVGIDNKDSVERTLGRPTFQGQFRDNVWYYLSRNTRQLAFANPRVNEQTLVRVTFDSLGQVAAVDRTGVETVVRLSPNSDRTPTLGRERSFFEELFGNIGTVGAAGAGAPGGRPPGQ
jgi:outer membrane protein assembly factor BamE (lipoprotein component of BamABCDE complex)